MAPFDPRAQTFILLAADGMTEIPVSVPDVNFLMHENLATSISYGSQLGASLLMLIVLLCMTPTARLAKAAQWVHIAALVVCVIRMTLLCIYFTSNWTEFYSFWSFDFSNIGPGDVSRSITTEIFSFLLIVLVQLSLGMQAWAMVNLLPDSLKWFFTGLSGVISLLAIAFRLVVAVVQIRAMLDVTWQRPMWVVAASTILVTVSIFHYCALFNIKLVIHLIVNRGILPTKSGLNPMEILVITNGLLMIIPVIFAGLMWGSWTNFESGSLTYTSVVVFLPLGTLIAQRAAVPSTSSDRTRQGNGSGHSSTPLKFGSIAGTTHTESNFSPSTVTSRVEASRSREPCDPIDAELRDIDEEDSPGNNSEKRGVRVNRMFDRHEERI